MIFCYGENRLFPESDFVHTKDGNIFQPPVHHVQPEHWATTGLLVDPETIPGVVSYNRLQGILEIQLIKSTTPDTPGVLGEDEGESEE